MQAPALVSWQGRFWSESTPSNNLVLRWVMSVTSSQGLFMWLQDSGLVYCAEARGISPHLTFAEVTSGCDECRGRQMMADENHR